MANLIRSLQRRSIERADTLTLAEYFAYNGNGYSFVPSGTLASDREEIAANFQGYVDQIYKSSGPVFSCIAARQSLFSQARFQFRQLRNGVPGDLFGTQALAPLEHPWPNGVTADLLNRAIPDVDIAGNFYAVRIRDQIYRRRPDWMSIILGEGDDPHEPSLIGYGYHPGGHSSGEDPVFYEPTEVGHFLTHPDPLAKYRGIGWVGPVLREILADNATINYKDRYFTQGASPNLIIHQEPSMPQDKVLEWGKMFRRQYEGPENAGKIMFLGGGATAQVVGANLRDSSFQEVIASSETRIASAAEVPPIVAGFQSGLDASTYSNYGQALRRFADLTIRPLWANFAASMATIIDEPPGAELWYDDRFIHALAEDVKDAADVQQKQATAIRQLTDGGYTPESVVDAITSGDLKRLVHTQLLPVQLHPPGSNGGLQGANQNAAV